MTQNLNRWAWHGLHFMLTLLLPLLFISLISCIKAKEEKEDLGPAVSDDAIDLALSKAIQGADLSGVRVGQSIEFVTTQRIENKETVETLGAQRVEVIDCYKTGTTPPEPCLSTDTLVTYILRITTSTRKSDGGFEVTVVQDELRLDRSVSLASLINKTKSMKAASGAQASSRKPIRITYHRLSESEATVEPPPAVKNRPGCGGLSPCELQIRLIAFDFVEWYSETSYQKYRFEFNFSVQTPFLPFGQEQSITNLTGVLIGSCQSTYVPVDGVSIYVRQCSTLENFQR